jgi:competence protein ComEC
LILFFFIAGILLGRKPDVQEISRTWVSGRICSEVLPRGDGYRALLDRLNYLQDGRWRPLKGKASIYFADSLMNARACPGMEILAKTRLSVFGPPGNPCQFDFARYQAGKGIHYRAYLEGTWMVRGRVPSKNLRIWSLVWRRKLISRLEREIGEEEGMALLSALLLGYREELQPRQRQNFARSGTMHILAVSGLHVGIIYLLPALLIGRLRPFPVAWTVGNLLIFCLLWAYALLTGLSPSVIRAVTMCCIHGIARWSGRRISSLHVLSLAAFFMILSRPLVIYEAGFQLSFAAVGGIMLIYPEIRPFFRFPGWIGRKLAGMVSVSLAAQLATLPLSIYYFHQCAPVSVLANLLAIPLASLLLYTGGAFFMFGRPEVIRSLLGHVLSTLGSWLDAFTELAGSLPLGYFDGLSISGTQVILGYLTGFGLMLFIRNKSPKNFFILMACAVLLAASGLVRESRIRSHKGIYVFDLPGEPGVGFVSGNQLLFYRPESGSHDTVSGEIPYETASFIRQWKLITTGENAMPGYWHREIHTACMDGDLIEFIGKRMLFLRRWDPHRSLRFPSLRVDVLLLCCNPEIRLSLAYKLFHPSLVIAAGNYGPPRLHRIELECMASGIRFHSIRNDGFIKIKQERREKK